MQSIHTMEGLLFSSYLSGYNLSFLHRCIKANDDDFKNDHHRKAAFATSDFDFERKIDRAKKLTESFINYCERNSILILSFKDEHYPKQLLAIKDFPPLLFIKGNITAIKSAAVVGTREPSPLALLKTDFIVKTFIENNYSIVSGLALGIDTLAHEAALKYQSKTIAVLPTSFDRIFPPENSDLANNILANGGALISEQAPNYGPVANPFVLRNRIIAAFSDYVIPIEMGKDSGTRHSLQYAVKYQKKLILCLPDRFEINNFLKHYDGIIVSVKKYKKKENNNVIVIRNLDAIPELLKSDIHSQHQLF